MSPGPVQTPAPPEHQLPAQNLLKGVALGIVTVFIGATVATAGKHLTSQVHISAIVFAQYAICLALALPALLRDGPRSLATRRPWVHLVRGISGCGCFYTYYLALKYISLADAALLRNTAPLVVPLIIFLWLGKRIPRASWLPLGLGFLGVLVVLRPGFSSVSVWHLVGFSSGVGLAISMVSTRVLAASEPENRILFYYFGISMLFALPFFLLNYQPVPLSALPWLVYIGAAMYFTFVLYTRAYSYVAASVLAPTSYFAVAFAGILDWWIWGYVPDRATLVGVLLIVGAGLLIVRPRGTLATD